MTGRGAKLITLDPSSLGERSTLPPLAVPPRVVLHFAIQRLYLPMAFNGRLFLTLKAKAEIRSKEGERLAEGKTHTHTHPSLPEGSCTWGGGGRGLGPPCSNFLQPVFQIPP